MKDILLNEILVAVGFLLVILIVWMVMSYYTKAKSHHASTFQQMRISTVIKQPSQVSRDFTIPFIPTPNNGVKEFADASILEEAELYSNHGRPAAAIKILLAFIKQYPSNVSAWSLLLSNYSSLGNVAEFEKAARILLTHLENHSDSAIWIKAQALGRTLDQNNPLYIDRSSSIYTSEALTDTTIIPRPIGDILIEMGILSEHELQSWLDDFDPMKHGRFGGHLLSHRVITLAQLDQDLLLQQR